MGIYTAQGLVNHAKNALELKTKYMYGGILREITEAYIKQLMRIYGINSGTGYTVERWKELMQLAGKGYYGVDCIGLVKSYYWSGKPNGGTGSPCYNPDTDINAKAMFYKATVKGKIKDLPEVPGLIVYSSAPVHVGVYIGNEQTIESTLGTRGDGVVKRNLDGLWTDWFECPFIDYPAKEKLKPVTLAYKAAIRSAPCQRSQKLGELQAGTKCVIVEGSDTIDALTRYVYVRLGGEKSQWIVKSAIQA